jgi:hypothetical protein
MAGPTPQKRKPRQHKPRTPDQAAVIQAAAEGAAPAGETFEFKDETFKISEKVGIWPLMQFARAAESGLDMSDYKALAALHAFLQDCIDAGDWGRFQERMISAKIGDADELLAVATTVIEKVTARPTPQPSASSNGQPAISGGSTAGSSSPAELASGS